VRRWLLLLAIPVVLALLVAAGVADVALVRWPVKPAEFTVYRVRARLRLVLAGADGDIHLFLADVEEPSRRMIAEIPHPLLALGSGFERVFRQERAALRRRRRPAGQLVVVTGIGFFDYHRHGNRSNGLELHPVIGLEFLPETPLGSPSPTPSPMPKPAPGA